jgi:hypothetical protein
MVLDSYGWTGLSGRQCESEEAQRIAKAEQAVMSLQLNPDWQQQLSDEGAAKAYLDGLPPKEPVEFQMAPRVV